MAKGIGCFEGVGYDLKQVNILDLQPWMFEMSCPQLLKNDFFVVQTSLEPFCYSTYNSIERPLTIVLNYGMTFKHLHTVSTQTGLYGLLTPFNHSEAYF